VLIVSVKWTKLIKYNIVIVGKKQCTQNGKEECANADVIKNTPTMRGFLVKNIARNNSDVYKVNVSD
jgi:hypothetical protein